MYVYRLLEHVNVHEFVLHYVNGTCTCMYSSPLNIDLEYSSLLWGEQTLALLCPANDGEPHLAIPELVKKVRTKNCGKFPNILLAMTVCI